MVSNLYLRLLTLHFFLNYLDIKAISLWFKGPLNAKSQDKIHYILYDHSELAETRQPEISMATTKETKWKRRASSYWSGSLLVAVEVANILFKINLSKEREVGIYGRNNNSTPPHRCLHPQNLWMHCLLYGKRELWLQKEFRLLINRP